MDMKWSLNELYTSFDSKKYQSDLKTFDEKMESFVHWAEENLKSFEEADKKISQYLNRLIELSSLSSKLMTYPRLISSVEAKNEMALKYLDKLQVKYSEITKSYVQFEKFIGSLGDLDRVINSSEFLKEHSFYLNNIKDILSIYLVKKRRY